MEAHFRKFTAQTQTHPQGQAGLLTSYSGPRSLTKGHRTSGAMETLGLFVVHRTTSAVAQTNNGLGDAWLGKRNRGGTPQRGSLSKTNPPLWNEKYLSGHVESVLV
jgi:hypothetical protein